MENTEIEIGNKHKLSRAAVMGLAPFVYLMVKSGDFELTQEEEIFVNGYIKFGYIVIATLLLAFVIGVFAYFTNNIIIYKFLDILSLVFTIGGIGLIFAGIFLIHAEKIVLQKGSIEYKKISSGNTNIMTSYVPFYNLVLWYTTKDIKTYWWLKESILFWTFFAIIGLFTANNILILIMLLLGIVRIVSALFGVDLVPDQTKEKLDKSFEKNPEELFRYIKGVVLYLFYSFLKRVRKSYYISHDLNSYIQNSKQEYWHIGNKNEKIILAEYIIFVLINVWIFWGLLDIIMFDLFWGIYLLPYVLVLGRYITALIIDQMPPIPVIHEIMLGVNKVIKF